MDSHQQQLTEWTGQKEKLEAELARQIPEMNLEQRLRQSDRRAVALGLPEGVALVEFVRSEVFDFKAVARQISDTEWQSPQQLQPARYLAFVLPAGEPDNVQMIDLGPADIIDRLIADLRASITGSAGPGRNMVKRSTESMAPTDLAGPALRAAVFDPLRTALGQRRRLLLAPDGNLSRLPFEVLPLGSGQRLLDEYEISYCNTGRDVLRFEAAFTGQAAEAIVIGDPDFDLVAGVVPAAASGYDPGTPPVPRFFCRSPELKPGHYHFDRLPGTRIESEYVANLLGVRPWLDRAALEGLLKQCHSPRILHLATHGFFLEDQKPDPNDHHRGFGVLGQADEIGRLSGPLPANPLLRAGLAMAGANTWLAAGALPPAAEDGLLTAEDVSGLDLLATELVVLSACETGVGEVRSGEGVFGLQRAFILAGAKTLVMSLWNVPDEQTQELMADFYRRILAGEPRRGAASIPESPEGTLPGPFLLGGVHLSGQPWTPPAHGHRNCPAMICCVKAAFVKAGLTLQRS